MCWGCGAHEQLCLRDSLLLCQAVRQPSCPASLPVLRLLLCCQAVAPLHGKEVICADRTDPADRLEIPHRLRPGQSPESCSCWWHCPLSCGAGSCGSPLMLPGPGPRSRTCHRVLSSTHPSAARKGSSMGRSLRVGTAARQPLGACSSCTAGCSRPGADVVTPPPPPRVALGGS